MNTQVIDVRGLVKRYGDFLAVDQIDLTVAKGEVVGLLGPNGAGKTTTILMLLGLTEPSAGFVRILGKDPLRQPLELKREVGYLPDSVGFYESMAGVENLSYIARLNNMPRAEDYRRIGAAVGRFKLSAVAHQPVSTYSRGMRQRLGLAELLMRECSVAILDEPTSGLDPQSTQELLESIQTLSKDGITILLSSHMLGAVQSVCHRIALFSKGRIGFIGSVDDLATRIGGSMVTVEVDAEGVDLMKIFNSIDSVSTMTQKPDGSWQVEASHDIRLELSRLIFEMGGHLRTLALSNVTLEQAYRRYFARGNHAA